MTRFETFGNAGVYLKFTFYFDFINTAVRSCLLKSQNSVEFQIDQSELEKVIITDKNVFIFKEKNKKYKFVDVDRSSYKVIFDPKIIALATKMRQSKLINEKQMITDETRKDQQKKPILIDKEQVHLIPANYHYHFAFRIDIPFRQTSYAYVFVLTQTKNTEITLKKMLDEGKYETNTNCVEFEKMFRNDGSFKVSKNLEICDPQLVQAFLTLKMMEKK